jgi:hypothetical protein
MLRARGRRNSKWDDSAFYCCELVAAAYQAMGVLSPPPEGRVPSNYMPCDFGCAEECLDLAPGVVLGPEQILSR